MSSSFNCLVDHCKSVHKWKDIACKIDGCNFVAYNNRCYHSHKTAVHHRGKSFARSRKHFSCTWEKCNASFNRQGQLDAHMRIHLNNLYKCSFCPYRSACDFQLKTHYRLHYGILDYQCEFCHKYFVTIGHLQLHVDGTHNREHIISCPKCDSYQGPRRLLQNHIRKVHKLFSKWDSASKTLETFERQ